MAGEKILIVEDERITAKALGDLLTTIGYQVIGLATSGEEAISKCKTLQPDLILMDIVLEGEMDGIKASETITQSYDVPIIFLTAYKDSETLQRAKITEPYGYIIKPVVDEKDLRPTIEIALYNHQVKKRLKNERFSGEKEEEFRGIIDLKLLTGWLEALSNPDRFIILDILRDHPLNMNHIQYLLEKSQSTSSHHIKNLESENIIRGWKKGKFTYYSFVRSSYQDFDTNWTQWLKSITNWFGG